MIKRIIACLTICLIITGLINPVFSHAEPVPIYTPNWSDPGIAEIIDISDLTGWMANGGVFDITDFQDLEEFLTWYFKIRVPMQDENGEVYFAPYYGFDKSLSLPDPEINLNFNQQSNVRGMIARSYQNKTGYGRRFQEQVDKALLEDGNLSNVNIPLMDLSEAAYFVGYNTNAIDYYKNIFLAGYDPGPEPAPDPGYESYLNTINGTGFTNFLNSITPHNLSSGQITRMTPLIWNNTISYYSVTGGFGNVAYSSAIYCFPLGDINIVTSGGTFTLSYNFSLIDNFFTGASNVVGNGDYYTTIGYYANINGYTYYGKGESNRPLTVSGNYSGTLQQCISYIQTRFKNVNIYVNGALWSKAGPIEEAPLTPEFPDVVGGDELPTTTWPLTVPKAPYYINLPGLRQAFQRAKNTDNEFDFNDLKDSVVDPEGDPVVDPEFETVPIPLPNPDPINPEVVPELPDLPLIPPANNPGFSGVSVLAEIINFTNQSLPSALITVFWGIVFGAVILGIIKILHK